MDGKIILTKESTPSQLEMYFRGVLALDEQDKVFSVNLDDVWQLCYPRKDHAVRELKNNFIENVDFIVIPKNGEQNSHGGNNRIDYYLTSACLEYFVARKVRPVFEVYRRVFHHVAHNLSQQPPSISEQMKAKITFADWSAKYLNLNDASKLGIAKKIAKDVGLDDTLPQAVNAGTEHPTTHAATDLLKAHGIELSTKAFNKVLEIKGVVKQCERPGKGNNVHHWMVLQPAFDKYGENQQDPRFQSQTQIRWYDAFFGELLTIVGLNKQQTLNLN